MLLKVFGEIFFSLLLKQNGGQSNEVCLLQGVTWSRSLSANKWCIALKQVDCGPFNMCAKCVMCCLCATTADTEPNQTPQCVHVFPCDLEIVQKEPECLQLGSSLHVCVRKTERTVFSQVSGSLVLSRKQKQNLTANSLWFDFSPFKIVTNSQREDWWQVTAGGLQNSALIFFQFEALDDAKERRLDAKDVNEDYMC